MDAISPVAPLARPRVDVPQATLAALADAYERGRHLDAFEIARRAGPLEAWRGEAATVWAGRLAGQLGARRLGHRLHLRAHREHPASLLAWCYAVRALHARAGAYVAREVMRREGPARGADDAVEALALRAELAAELHDLDEAERHLARALALAPEEPWLHVVRGEVDIQADAYEAGLAAADGVLARAPSFRPAADLRAELLVLLGREEEALAFLREVQRRFQAASTAIALLELELDLGRIADAEATLGRVEALTPLRERALSGYLEARRADVAYERGDVAAAAAHARRSRLPFYEKLAERLGRPDEARRVRLPVPWVRQHRLTCAPATMTALVRHFGGTAEHLEIAEAICYDGTPREAQRRWAEARGLVAREFTVTWDAARALLDRGVPFALVTAHPDNAHMQAVVGYDERRGTLLLRDPGSRPMAELAAEGLAEYAHCGPQGLVLLPPAEAHRLEGVELPEAALYDAYDRVQAGLVAHDRASAAAAADALERLAPGHRLLLHARRSIAGYDGDAAGRLRSTEALLALFPDDVDLRLARQGLLAELGREEARAEWLRAECARAGHPLLDLALADVLRLDARARDEALSLARRAARRMATKALAYHILGDVHWDRDEREEALVAHRAAACLEPTNEHFAEAHFQAARLVRRGAEAIEFLRGRFERLGRKAPGPAMTLVESLELVDREREAREVLERALALRPNDGGLLLFAAGRRAAAGDAAGAGDLLARAAGAARPVDLKRTTARLAEERGELAEAASLWAQVADLEPFDLDAVRAAARLLDAAGEPGAGVAFLRARVARHPHHLGLGHALAEALADGAAADREGALRAILEAHPSDAWAWRELALALAASRPGEALAALERGRALDPGSAACHRVTAAVLEACGRGEEAKEALRAALRTSVDDEWSLRGLLRMATGAEERERHLAFVHAEIVRQVLSGDALLAYQRAAAGVLDPERLVAELRAAFEARPDLWHAWAALARQLSIAGRSGEAVELLSRAAERFELSAAVWHELALAHHAAGDRAAQRRALERAVALAPAWAEAIGALAQVMFGDRELEAARALLARAVRRIPTVPMLRGWLADVAWAQGDREAAVAELETALRLDPRYGWAWSALVLFSRELGRPDAPRAVAERLAAARPHDPDAWVLVARARDATDARLEAVDRALAVAPRHVAALELRAEILAEAGRHEEARAATEVQGAPRELRLRAILLRAAEGEPGAARLDLDALLEHEPDFAPGWEQLADWHHEAGRHVDGVAASRRLVRLAPNEPSPHAYLGRALLAAGEREEGKAALRRAAELDPAYLWPARRLFDAELEDANPDGAAAALALVERHAPAEAPLLRLRVAAARSDRAAAFAELEALARAGERWLLDAAAPALSTAGWAAELDRRLDALLEDPAASRAAGALCAARAAGPRGRPRAFRRRLDALLSRPGRTNALRGAIESYLHTLAERRQARALRRFLSRHGATVAEDVLAWASAGYALAATKQPRRAVEWLSGWRERAGVVPWMLENLACALCDLGRVAEARDLSGAALALPRDHASPLLEVRLAVEAALAGDPGPASRLGRPREDEPAYYGFLRAMASALVASAGEDRRRGFDAALDHLRRAATLVPRLADEPYLRRVRREALRRVVARRAARGPLRLVFAAVARVRARPAPASRAR